MRTAITLSACLVVVLGLVRRPDAQALQAPAMSPTEQAAMDVVNTWNAGWNEKDPQKVSSTMAEDTYMAGAYPNDPIGGGVSRGRARFFAENAQPISSGITFKTQDFLAVGGTEGTAVLIRRTDESSGLGQLGAPGAQGARGQGPAAAAPGAAPATPGAAPATPGAAPAPPGAAAPAAPGGQGGRGRGPTWFVNTVFYWVKDGKILIWYDIPSFFPPVPVNQAVPTTSWRSQEQAALDVVKEWVEAWNAKDPDKVASYMRDDALYSADYPRNITELGKAHFLAAHRRSITQGVQMRIAQSAAIGGPVGVGVLLRRIDRFLVNGRQQEVPNASFFWVVNGKIHTWLDLPLEAPPKDASGMSVVR